MRCYRFRVKLRWMTAWKSCIDPASSEQAGSEKSWQILYRALSGRTSANGVRSDSHRRELKRRGLEAQERRLNDQLVYLSVQARTDRMQRVAGVLEYWV